MLVLQSFLRLFDLLAIAWLMSEQRSIVSWRTVIVGVGVQYDRRHGHHRRHRARRLRVYSERGGGRAVAASVGGFGHQCAAAVSIANLMIPPTLPPSAGVLDDSSRADSFMGAVIGGTQSGLILLLNVAALLLVLVAMVRSVNAVLACLPSIAGGPVTLQRGVGLLMTPIVWLLGIPWSEAVTAGGLLGTKIVLNEFIAYFELTRLEPGALSERSKLIMTYCTVWMRKLRESWHHAWWFGDAHTRTPCRAARVGTARNCFRYAG